MFGSFPMQVFALSENVAKTMSNKQEFLERQMRSGVKSLFRPQAWLSAASVAAVVYKNLFF